MKQLPNTFASPVLRTDFSDQKLWKTIRHQIQQPSEEGFEANVEFIDDPAYDGLNNQQMLEALPPEYPHTFIIVVDRKTISDPEHPLLIVNLVHGFVSPVGQELRTLPSQTQLIESNLSIANVDFSEFVSASGSDGVFRGLDLSGDNSNGFAYPAPPKPVEQYLQDALKALDKSLPLIKQLIQSKMEDRIPTLAQKQKKTSAASHKVTASTPPHEDRMRREKTSHTKSRAFIGKWKTQDFLLTLNLDGTWKLEKGKKHIPWFALIPENRGKWMYSDSANKSVVGNLAFANEEEGQGFRLPVLHISNARLVIAADGTDEWEFIRINEADETRELI